MSEIVRMSVSLEADLLDQFNRYCRDGQFATRSEAVRQLFREALTAHAWEMNEGEVAATLTLVFDHHKTHLSERLLHIQHQHAETVISTMHVHLDHDTCLEVIVLRGRGEVLREVAAELRGLKGVHTAQLVPATSEQS